MGHPWSTLSIHPEDTGDGDAPENIVNEGAVAWEDLAL
jgi:hypothetical protein